MDWSKGFDNMSYRTPQSSAAVCPKPQQLGGGEGAYCPADREAMMRSPELGCGSGVGYNNDRVKNNVLEEICADIGPQDAMEWDLFDFYEPYTMRPPLTMMEEGDSYDQPIAFSDKEAKVELQSGGGGGSLGFSQAVAAAKSTSSSSSATSTSADCGTVDMRYGRPPFQTPGSREFAGFSGSGITVKKEDDSKSSPTDVFQPFSVKSSLSSSNSNSSLGRSSTTGSIVDNSASSSKVVEAVSRPSAASRRSPAGTKHGASDADNCTDDMKHQQQQPSSCSADEAMITSSTSKIGDGAGSEMSAKRARVISTANDLLEEVRNQYSFVKGAEFFTRPAAVPSSVNSAVPLPPSATLSRSSSKVGAVDTLSDVDDKSSSISEKRGGEETASCSTANDSGKATSVSGGSEPESPAPTFAQSLKGLNDMYDKYGLRPKALPSTPVAGTPRLGVQPPTPFSAMSSPSPFGNTPDGGIGMQQQFNSSSSSSDASPINYRQLYMQKIMMRQNLMQRTNSTGPLMGSFEQANSGSANMAADNSPFAPQGSGAGVLSADRRADPYTAHAHDRYDDFAAGDRMPPFGMAGSSGDGSGMPPAYQQQQMQGAPQQASHCHCAAKHSSEVDMKPYWMQGSSGGSNRGGGRLSASFSDQQMNKSSAAAAGHYGMPLRPQGQVQGQSCSGQCSRSSSLCGFPVRGGDFDNGATGNFDSLNNHHRGLAPSSYETAASSEFPSAQSYRGGGGGGLAMQPMIPGGGFTPADYSRPVMDMAPQMPANDPASCYMPLPRPPFVSNGNSAAPSFQPPPGSGMWKEEPQQAICDRGFGNSSIGGEHRPSLHHHQHPSPHHQPPQQQQPPPAANSSASSFQSSLIHQIIMDRSSAFRSHPLFPLLRDLTIADMNFDSPSFPFQLIASLPTDFSRLLQNFLNRNPMVAAGYRTNDNVERVIIDALKHAHGALIEKLDNRKRQEGIMPSSMAAPLMDDFCEHFDRVVSNNQGCHVDYHGDGGMEAGLHGAGMMSSCQLSPQGLAHDLDRVKDGLGAPPSSANTKNKVLPKEAVALMMDWLIAHQNNPYPNDDEKEMLMRRTRLSINQINYWFTNARRRILPKWSLQRYMDHHQAGGPPPPPHSLYGPPLSGPGPVDP